MFFFGEKLGILLGSSDNPRDHPSLAANPSKEIIDQDLSLGANYNTA